VHFFRQVVGAPVVSKELLSQRTSDYQNWVEAFARNHKVPIQWAEKWVRKEDYVQPWLRRMVRKDVYGVYFIFKSPVSADDLVMVGKFLVDVAQRARTAVAEKIWLENEPHRFGFNRIGFDFCAALLGASIRL
jgi:hypothetical protein